MKLFEKWVKKISGLLTIIACFITLVLIVVTVIDVTGRYVLQSPMVGAQDISEWLIVILIYSALGNMIRDRAYIRADLIGDKLSKRNGAILNCICMLFVLIVGIIWTWQTALDYFRSVPGEEITLILLWPIRPLYAYIAFGLFVMSIEVVLDMIRYFKEAKEAGGVEKIESKTYDDKLYIE